MEDLQHTLSISSVDDLTPMLISLNGKCEGAGSSAKILQLQRMGLTGGDSARYNKQSQQSLSSVRMVTSSSTVSGNRRFKNQGRSRRGLVAPYSSRYATMPHPSPNETDVNPNGPLYMPPFIEDEKESCKVRQRERGRCYDSSSPAMSRELGQSPRHGPSSDSAVSISSDSISYTKNLVKRLSSAEKDQLLCRFLTRPRGQEETVAPVSIKKTVSSTKELEVYNIQAAQFLSFQEGNKSPIDDLNDEAMKLGIQASKREFRDLCRRQGEEEEMRKSDWVNDEAMEFGIRASNREFWEWSQRKDEAEELDLLELAQLSSPHGFVRSSREKSAILEEAKQDNHARRDLCCWKDDSNSSHTSTGSMHSCSHEVAFLSHGEVAAPHGRRKVRSSKRVHGKSW